MFEREEDSVDDVNDMFGLMEAVARLPGNPASAMLFSLGEDGGHYPSAEPEVYSAESIRGGSTSVLPPVPFEGHIQRLAGLPPRYRFAAVALLDMIPAQIAASLGVQKAREVLQVSGVQEEVMKHYVATA